MDVATILERAKLLTDQGNFAGLKELCKATDLIVLSKLVRLAHEGLTDGIRQLMAALPERDRSAMPIIETEIDPKSAVTLVEAGIVTLGDLQRTPNELLLQLREFGDMRKVWLVRAVQEKYLGTETGQKKNAKRGKIA